MFGNDVISYHWVYILAYLVEHRIGSQSSNFRCSKLSGSNFTEGVENTFIIYLKPYWAFEALYDQGEGKDSTLHLWKRCSCFQVIPDHGNPQKKRTIFGGYLCK